MIMLYDLKVEVQSLLAPSQNCSSEALGNTPFGGDKDSVPPFAQRLKLQSTKH